MIKYDGVTYRNLEEQVRKNQEDIEHLSFGLNVIGQSLNIPDFEANLGDAWIVGDIAHKPIQYYIYLGNKQWFNLGTLESTVPGPEGKQGLKGETGKGIERVEVLENPNNLVVYYTDGTHEELGSIRGPMGPQGIRGIQGPRGLQGPKGDPGSMLTLNELSNTFTPRHKYIGNIEEQAFYDWCYNTPGVRAGELFIVEQLEDVGPQGSDRGFPDFYAGDVIYGWYYNGEITSILVIQSYLGNYIVDEDDGTWLKAKRIDNGSTYTAGDGIEIANGVISTPLQKYLFGYNPEGIPTENGYVRMTGWLDTNPDTRNTGLITISPGATIEYYDKLAPSGAVIAFYDVNQKFLKDKSIPGAQDGNIHKVIVPEGVAYFNYSVYGSSYIPKAHYKVSGNGGWIITQDETVKALQEKTNNTYLNSFGAIKKFGLVGDSLSVGHTWDPSVQGHSSRNIQFSWGQYLARTCGNICLNFGHSGVDARRWLTSSDCKPYLVDPQNKCQVYIVNLGANDADNIQGNIYPLGSLADINFNNMELNKDTFYGYYAKVLDTIRKTNDKAIIIVMSVFAPRDGWEQVIPVNQAIKEIATNSHFTNTYFIDMSKYSPAIKNTIIYPDQYTHTHWTALGYKYISEIMNTALNDLIKANTHLLDNLPFIPYGNNNVIN